jgi:RNA polymerase sigma factor (TIGR02999 family)
VYGYAATHTSKLLWGGEPTRRCVETPGVSEITELLGAVSDGDAEASRRLFTLMYAELKNLARASLRKSGGRMELDTTSLVHESFLRLAGRTGHTPANKRAFYVYVGKVMRSVVLDAVRERQALKRGGDQVFVTLSTTAAEQPVSGAELIAIDEALSALNGFAPELKELVEMRYFAGLTVEEIGELLGKSPRAVQREWEKGRMLLRRLIEEA